MSYHAYREDSSEESDEDSASASATTSNPHFDPISEGESSSPAASPVPSNDDDYSHYLRGPGSQSATYVSRLATKCNVIQLKKILTQSGVTGISQARKPFLIKKAVEYHNGLDEGAKKRFQSCLADPSGKEYAVTSTINDDSPEYGGRPSRSGHNWRQQAKRSHRPNSSPEYSMDDDDEDYEIPPPAPRRINHAVAQGPLSDSESSNSPSDDNPERAHGGSSRERASGSGTNGIARGRIVLTLPKVKTTTSSADSGPGSATSTILRIPKTTAYPGRYDHPSTTVQPGTGSKSPIRPYVPRTASSATVQTSTTWPPPLPVENQRKRSNDHFSNGESSSSATTTLGSVIAPKRAVLNAPQPTMQQSVAPPAPYIPISSHAQNYSFYASQVNGGYQMFPSMGQNSDSGGGGTSSTGQMTRAMSCFGQGFPTQAAAYNALMSRGSSHDDPAMSPHSLPIPPPPARRDFVSASSLAAAAASRDPRMQQCLNGMALPSQRNSVIHPYPGVSNPSSMAAAQRVNIAPGRAGMPQQQQPSTPVNGSSIMVNNPFAQVFSNGHASASKSSVAAASPQDVNSTANQNGKSSSSEPKGLHFKVENPSPPRQDLLSGHSGRVIKAPVFHETMWQVREPLSIRRDQTLTTRGVYREIIITFYFNQGSVSPNDPNTVLLFRFCQESQTMAPSYEMHPDNLKLMLNGKTLVEPTVVDFSNRMKKKKNAVYSQPIEVGLNLLAQQNVVLVRWTEDGAQTGQPPSIIPDEPPKEFFLIVECARRKTMEAILQTVNVNRVPVKDTVFKLFQTLGGGDDDIVTDSQKISLHCPASRARLNIPVRGRNCDHIDCFDVSSYLFMNKSQKARWTCPKCNKSVQFDEIVVDEFMQSLLKTFPTSEGIDATLENKEIVVREAKKPQKSESNRSAVETVGKSSGNTPTNSTSSSASTISAASTNRSQSTSAAHKPPPDVITLD